MRKISQIIASKLFLIDIFVGISLPLISIIFFKNSLNSIAYLLLVAVSAGLIASFLARIKASFTDIFAYISLFAPFVCTNMTFDSLVWRIIFIFYGTYIAYSIAGRPRFEVTAN